MPDDQKNRPDTPQENLSFEALSQELGDLPKPPTPKKRQHPPAKPGPPSPPSETPAGTSFSDLAGDEAGPEFPEKVLKASGTEDKKDKDAIEDRLNARVLTGSAPKPKPMWIQAAGVGILACVLCYFTAHSPHFAGVQRMMGYASLAIAAGALFWSAYGMTDGTKTERRLCGIGLTLGTVAALWALLILR